MSDVFALARLSRKMANAAERFYQKKTLSVDKYLKMQEGFRRELEAISGRPLDELVQEAMAGLDLELEPLDGDMELIGFDEAELDALCTDDGRLDELLADDGGLDELLEQVTGRAARGLALSSARAKTPPKTRRKGRKRAEAIPALSGR